MMDDFEDATDVGINWSVRSAGNAAGQLQYAPGHNGKGASLTADFSAADAGAAAEAWVAARRHITYQGENRTEALAVGFWARSEPGIALGLNVYCSADSASKPTYSYQLQRPLSSLDPSQWYRHVVRLPTDSCSVSDVEIVAYDVQENGAQTIQLSVVPSAFRTKAALYFDELTFSYDGFSAQVDAFGTLVAPAAGPGDLSDQFGVNSENAEVYWNSSDPALLNHDLDAMKDAGIKWLRTDLLWARNETQVGVYDFSEYDPLVLGAKDRGMKLVAVLDYCNPLYAGCGSNSTLDGGSSGADHYGISDPAARDAFGQYAKAAVEHFKTAAYSGLEVSYEVWNEPNQYWDLYYPDGGSGGALTLEQKARQYAQTAGATIAKIREADPAAKVCTAGILTWDYQFLRNYLNEGLTGGATAIGTHPYRNLMSSAPMRRTDPESFVDDLVLWRDIVNTFVSTKPSVWTTEWGYQLSAADGESELVQAAHAVRMMLTTAVVGMPFSIWFRLRDVSSTPSLSGYGLYGPHGEEQPALWALRQLGSATRGRTFEGFLPVGLSNVTGIRLDGPNDIVFVVWSSLAPDLAQSTSLTLLSAASGGVSFEGAAASTMWGTPVSVSPQPTSLTIPVVGDRGGPTYITVKKTAAPDAGADALPDAPADSSFSQDASPSLDSSLGHDAQQPLTDSSAGRDSAPDAVGGGFGVSQSPGDESSGCGCRTARTQLRSAGFALLASLMALAKIRRNGRKKDQAAARRETPR